MSALSDLVKYAMTGDVMYHGEKYKRAKEAADELSDLLAQLDKAVAWHEGEDSPHAELEAQLAALRLRAETAEAKLAEARRLLKNMAWAQDEPWEDVYKWLIANPEPKP